MRRHIAGERRTRLQSGSDDATLQVQAKLGRALRDARTRRRWTQARAAAEAGISRGEWSGLELGKRDATLWLLNRAAHAVGGRLAAYVDGASAADQPRDAVHLRYQALVLRTANAGGWRGVPEHALDRELMRSRHGDVVLDRHGTRGTPVEWCLVEVVDWVADVGESVRDFDRRLAALDRCAVARMQGDGPVPATSGVWLLRATQRNRSLVGEHRHFFRARFPGSGRAWLAALTDPNTPMPGQPALLWVDVRGTRIFAARLGSARLGGG